MYSPTGSDGWVERRCLRGDYKGDARYFGSTKECWVWSGGVVEDDPVEGSVKAGGENIDLYTLTRPFRKGRRGET